MNGWRQTGTIRTRWIAAATCALALTVLPDRPVFAEAPAPVPVQPSPGPDSARKPSTLDDLFARLAAASDEGEARGIASLIERRFERSGSDTADLLMERAGIALKGEDASLAVELLDRVTQLKPGWAEPWSRRAAAFFQLEDPVRAMEDLRAALAREPRHFGAWAALGHLEMASGDKALALAAYRRALKIHPFFEDLRKIVDRLAPEVDGRDL